MHLRQLSLSNLRVFREAALELPPVDAREPFSNVHLFLGTNGSGKTSLLRAIAMAAVAAVLPSSGMRPYSLVRRVVGQTQPEACVIDARFDLAEQDQHRGQLRSRIELLAMHGFNDKFGHIDYPGWAEKDLWMESSPSAFVVGYGASRLPEPERVASSDSERGRNLRYHRVAGLFEEYVPLKPLRAWLPAYRNKGRHTQVINLVNKLLSDVDMSLLPQPEEGEYLFESKGARLPLSALSDGYRAYIGWISDLLYHVCLGCPPGKMLWENQGIVLVDEIDLHLHPQWQRVVIERLSTTLPHLQFFFTTHSPLIAGSVPAGHTYVVDTQDWAAGALLRPSPEDVYGWSADQILNSALFAQTPPRNARATEAIRAHAARARSGSRDDAMALMSVLAEGMSHKPAPKRGRGT